MNVPSGDSAREELALREAAHWMARITGEEFSAADREAFQQWLRVDHHNLAAMKRVERTWIVVDGLRDKRSFEAQRLRARHLRLATSGIASCAWMKHVPRTGLLATALLVLIGVARVFPPANYGTTAAHSSKRGQVVSIQLPDGSLARLNSDSKILIRYRWFVREVKLLKGEAEFAVAHRDFRPFFVRTHTLAVRATGTVFTVSSVDDTTRVFLSEGSVQLREHAAGNVLATLRPGERATAQGSKLIELIEANPRRELAWRNGQVVFVATTLPDAIAQFKRYTDVEVTLAKGLDRIVVSGAYRNTDVISFLDGLTRIYPLRWRWSGAGHVTVELQSAASLAM